VSQIKGRNRHIITDTLGHLLGVIAHAANGHDTTEGPRVYLHVVDKYPSIQATAADQGYRGTTVNFVEEWLKRRVDITTKAASGFVVQPKRWIVERTLAWLGNFRSLAKDFENRTQTVENMIRIAMLKVTVAKCVQL
jgi:putative transposase